MRATITLTLFWEWTFLGRRTLLCRTPQHIPAPVLGAAPPAQLRERAEERSPAGNPSDDCRQVWAVGRAIPGGELPSLEWELAEAHGSHHCGSYLCLASQLVVAEDSVLCDCLPDSFYLWESTKCIGRLLWCTSVLVNDPSVFPQCICRKACTRRQGRAPQRNGRLFRSPAPYKSRLGVLFLDL